MRAGRGVEKSGADTTAASTGSSSGTKRNNMKEALQAAAATAAANTLGAGVVSKAVMTGAAAAAQAAVGGAASCHLPTAATAATATALMGVQKPPLLPPSTTQPPQLLKDLVLRGHGLVPPTTASALATAARGGGGGPSLAPPLRLRSAPGVEGFANASPEHPLDPLSIQELEAAGLLAGKALAASRQHAEPMEAIRLADVALLEPPKPRLVTYQGKSLKDALAWGMPRMAQCVAFSVASGKTYRVLVDLSAGVSAFVRLCVCVVKVVGWVGVL